jgi:aminobenzoyl-glutamate utilization protein B
MYRTTTGPRPPAPPTTSATRACWPPPRYLTATAIDLITDPDLLAGIKEEHRQRREGVQWRSLLPDDAQPPIYQPPAEFLRRTGQSWPPPGIRWPVEPIIAHEQLGTTGPDLPPVT